MSLLPKEFTEYFEEEVLNTYQQQKVAQDVYIWLNLHLRRCLRVLI